ncbi:MAG: ABC transporter ATP-binding protein [Myxococcota bacterium]
MSETLTVKNLRIELGGKTILRELAFEVSPGEVVGLIGCNGAGKTTLLKVANGALVPAEGEVQLSGTSARSLGRREWARRVALVPQDLHVPFPFRVGELVLMGRAPHQPLVGLESEADVALALAALERLGIGHLADRSVDTLSGGERQLVLFARALVQEPGLLLLDEPTAFLDLKHRVEVLREVRQFAAGGRAALVVSHDLSLAARSCDRVILLGGGRIIADGLPVDVFTQANLQAAFGIETHTGPGPDGKLVVVPDLGSEPSEEGS